MAVVICRNCQKKIRKVVDKFPTLYDWCKRCQGEMLEYFEYQMTKRIGRVRFVLEEDDGA
jgi:hypothetical protein